VTVYRKTVAQLSEGLRRKEFSSVELTRVFLERILASQPKLNALISVTAEEALQCAQAADRALASGNATPLTGVPIVHKDIFCTQGVKTTCGSRMLENFVAPYDATVVAKLKGAGTVMLGKANMDEFAMGSSNETSFFGAVRNPWNTDLVPGGSSGGSAAVVAARLAPAATATDTGGSIRQPAALCGVTGVKPTYGRVSRYGMIAFASSLDQGGIIAATAEDAALLLRAMAGFDPNDSTSVEREVPDYFGSLNAPLEGLKIGLLKEFFDKGLDAEVERRIRDALSVYEKLGATLPGTSKCLFPPPFRDRRMVAGQQHRRHLAELVRDRPRVVRAVEQAVRERILLRRGRVVERAVLQPSDRIDQHRRGQLAAREHVVADRNLFVDFMLDQALVHRLVAPAEEDQPIFLREFTHLVLGKPRSLRTQENRPNRPRIRRPRRAQCVAQRVDQHHHARAAAERSLVHAPISIGRIIARIPAMHVEQTTILRPPDHADPGRRVDELREQRDDIHPHG